jgi:hypothetical protein
MLLGPGLPFATAHSTPNMIFVPRLAADRPTPTVDGSCGRQEYAAARRVSILYRPGVSWEPASVSVVTNQEQLWVCVSGLPRRFPNTVDEPFFSIELDADHDGGRVPGEDDVQLRVAETGPPSALQGDGSGSWVPTGDPFWTGRRSVGDLTWSAEFATGLHRIGGGSPATFTGVRIAHNAPVTPGSDYSWPARSVYGIPSTWGDIFWLRAPTGPGAVHVDVARITQGLEMDVTARVPYVYVAGKDTLARAQVYTLGSPGRITYSACRIRRIAPTTGPLRLFPPSAVPAPRINTAPVGFFNGSPRFDCWIRGADVRAPGRYRFELELGFDGDSRRQIIDLGTEQFVPGADMRLLLLPWDSRGSGAGDQRAWGADLSAAVPEAMNEFVRHVSLPAGIGNFNWSGAALPSAPPGLRYSLSGAVAACRNGETGMQCDARTRGASDAALRRLNSDLRALDERDGRRRDRFDWGMLLFASTGTGGGQACWEPQRVGGIGFDNQLGGASAAALSHEVSHCMGQVRGASPHSDGGSHSTTGPIPPFRGLPMVNMRSRTDVVGPGALMNPTVTNTGVMITEGYEWNDFWATLIRMPDDPTAFRSTLSAAEKGKDVFQFIATIDQSDVVTFDHSLALRGSFIKTTPSLPDGTHSLVLVDAEGVELSRTRFTPRFEAPDAVRTVDSISLTVPLPSTAAGVEVRKADDGVVFSADFTTEPPVIHDVVAVANEAGDVDLTWSASDADNESLRYNLWFRDGRPRPATLVAAGVTDTAFTFDTEVAPATEVGKIVIEATDGLNIARRSSASFVVDHKPPVTAIAAPVGDHALTPEVLFLGSGYDFTAGPLAGNALKWRSNVDGALGAGARLEKRLSPGAHEITLTAKAPSGLVGKATTDVMVEADSDEDGLAGSYESAHPCLKPAKFDAQRDPDDDLLASFGEHAAGTDPCSPDSDGDGFGDGAEVGFGADPTDDGSTPQPDAVFPGRARISLGDCPDPKTRRVSVTTATPETTWSVHENVRWLSVVGGDKPGDGSVSIIPDCKGLAVGTHEGMVLIAEALEVKVVEVVLRKPAPHSGVMT